jgi:hypothetical protein
MVNATAAAHSVKHEPTGNKPTHNSNNGIRRGHNLKIQGRLALIEPESLRVRRLSLHLPLPAIHSATNSMISAGELLSGLCALHCVAYILLVTALSFGSIGSFALSDHIEWLEGIWWHISFGAGAALFALMSRRTISKHGSVPTLFDTAILAALSLMIISIGLEVAASYQIPAHQGHHHKHESAALTAHILFICGNMIILASHYWARKIVKKCRGECIRGGLLSHSHNR